MLTFCSKKPRLTLEVDFRRKKNEYCKRQSFAYPKEYNSGKKEQITAGTKTSAQTVSNHSGPTTCILIRVSCVHHR